MLDRYLETLDVEPTTRARYEGIIRNHLRPALGTLPLSKLDGDILDRFFAQLRRWRERCNGRVKHVKHRAQREHECDEACWSSRAGRCRYRPCVRRTGCSTPPSREPCRGDGSAANPLDATQPPPLPSSNPSPPSPAEAPRLLQEAWKDPDWGTFVWTANDDRPWRGELCALRRADVGREADPRADRAQAGGPQARVPGHQGAPAAGFGTTRRASGSAVARSRSSGRRLAH
jgi:integrase